VGLEKDPNVDGAGIRFFIGRARGLAMSISPIGSNSPITRLQGSTAVGFSQGSQDVGRSVSDSVEFSDTARYLGELKNLPDVRQDKVQAARDAIAAGKFETPERLNGTVDALLRDFR
jgi:hypothetical protein